MSKKKDREKEKENQKGSRRQLSVIVEASEAIYGARSPAKVRLAHLVASCYKPCRLLNVRGSSLASRTLQLRTWQVYCLVRVLLDVHEHPADTIRPLCL